QLHELCDDGGQIVAASGPDDEHRERTRHREHAALEQLLDDRRALVERQARGRERHAELVVALDDAREAAELVLDLRQAALGLRDLEDGAGVRVDAIHYWAPSPRINSGRPGR